MQTDAKTLYAALDREFSIDKFHDVSNNGLQVSSPRKTVSKVCSGVDATLPFFKEAARRGADLVICHHGISWGDSLRRIDGLNYELVSFLVENRIALWACHLPLDAHPVLGNNAQICKALGLGRLSPFYDYHGETIGFKGELPRALFADKFTALLTAAISPAAEIRAHLFGAKKIRSVGVVSGGAADGIAQAADEGLDAYVTGETDLQSYNLCLQLGGNMFAAGHYATERFGIRATGEWIAGKFGVEHEFIDFGIPL